jgi:hypothetical protein
VNETFTKFLISSSDRALRLFEIDYANILAGKKGLFLLYEFQDVISKKKWMNANFFKLSQNQRLE